MSPFTGLKVGESVWEHHEFLKCGDGILFVSSPLVLAEVLAQMQGFNSIWCMAKWRKAWVNKVKSDFRKLLSQVAMEDVQLH